MGHSLVLLLKMVMETMMSTTWDNGGKEVSLPSKTKSTRSVLTDSISMGSQQEI